MLCSLLVCYHPFSVCFLSYNCLCVVEKEDGNESCYDVIAEILSGALEGWLKGEV